MPRRRFRRGARKRARALGWFGALVPNCWNMLTPISCRQTEPPDSDGVELFELIGPEDREMGNGPNAAGGGFDVSMRVERLVGEITFLSHIQGNGHDGPAVQSFWAGIYVTEAADDGSIVSLSPGMTWDPTLGAETGNDEKASWMWVYSWHHAAALSNVSQSIETNQYSPSSHFDIRVKRRLRGRDGVYLATQVTFDEALGTGGIVTYSPWLSGHMRMLLAR